MNRYFQKEIRFEELYIMITKKIFFTHSKKLLLQSIHTYYNENENFMTQNGNESSNHTKYNMDIFFYNNFKGKT